DVVTLLFEALFEKHIVDCLDVGNDLEPFILPEHRVTTLLGKVEIVRRHSDYEPIIECRRAIKHPHVADVEYVKCAEGDHGLARHVHCSLLIVSLAKLAQRESRELIVSLAKLAQHCVFGNLRGSAARAGEDGPPTMRPWRVANLLNAHRLHALDCEGFNIGPSERPGWTVHW